MNTVTLHFRADNQKLTPLDGIYKYASNTVEYIRAVFDLGENWTDFDVVRAAWFTDYDCIVTVLDPDGVCVIPAEVLNKRTEVCVNLFGCDVEEDELIDRLTTYPIKAVLIDANARVCGSETAPITPSQFEQFIAIVEDIVHSVKDIDHTELNADYTLTIYYTDGTSDTVGPIRGEQGPVGPTGNGISKIEKVGTAGLVDTYRITYTNGQTYDYTVTNGAQGPQGNGIVSIYKSGESGAVKTYTILFTDGNTFEYNVTDGEVTFATLEQLMPKDTASGSIASFPDGQAVFPLQSCVVDIDPIQDLHGYTNPWVGGGGKNKFDSTQVISTANFSQNGETFTSTSTDTRAIVVFVVQAFNDSTYLASSNSVTASATGRYNVTLTPPEGTNRLWIKHSGTARDFTIVYPYTGTSQITISVDITSVDPSVVGGVVFKNIQIELGSTATTWQPYSNICPISGWVGCEVTKCGVNIFDGLTEDGRYNISDGEPIAYSGTRCVNFVAIKPNTQYYIKCTDNVYVIEYDANKEFVRYKTYFNNSVYTSSADAYYIKFYLIVEGATGISINYPSTDHDYHTFNGTTYPISWQTEAGTVYGGTVDAVSGVLTVTEVLVDLGTLTWKKGNRNNEDTGYTYRTALSPEPKNLSVGLSSIGFVFKTSQMAWEALKAGEALFTTPTFVTIGDYADADAFKTAMNGVQLVYELATPITYQLTPQQIATLYGTNNIFADSGAVAVNYIADIGLYIDKKTQ